MKKNEQGGKEEDKEEKEGKRGEKEGNRVEKGGKREMMEKREKEGKPKKNVEPFFMQFHEYMLFDLF